MSKGQVASFWEASGEITYNMTNNFMFRYILQENENVLIGLVSALLHLEPEEIKEIEILNPIDLSEDVAGKEFILDIKVRFNDNTLINLEMQVKNEHNWTERSLSYLCRNYDQLYRGQEYEEALPVYHIGFLDFTLFPDYPEFYATYRMLNVKNYHLYSDKITLGVVDLSRTELATEEDKAYEIDYWARLFKAKTWEDLRMLAQNNKYLEEAGKSLYVANGDDILLQKCRAREEAERRERTMERDIRILNEQLAKKDEQLSEKDEQLSEKDAQLQSERSENARLRELLKKSGII